MLDKDGKAFRPDGGQAGTLIPPAFAGLWTHQTGGFYHDGRFPNLAAVIDHYDRNFRLGLNAQEKTELIEYLKSL